MASLSFRPWSRETGMEAAGARHTCPFPSLFQSVIFLFGCCTHAAVAQRSYLSLTFLAEITIGPACQWDKLLSEEAHPRSAGTWPPGRLGAWDGEKKWSARAPERRASQPTYCTVGPVQRACSGPVNGERRGSHTANLSTLPGPTREPTRGPGPRAALPHRPLQLGSESLVLDRG